MPNYRRDLTEGGMYFFTVVLENRQSQLLSKYIDEFRSAYVETQKFYPFKTEAVCILPDHFHLIMQLPDNDDNYSVRIQNIKRNFTKRLPNCLRQLTDSKYKHREAGIWQRRFWEHFIRDEQDLNNHIDYIYYNPVKHGYVTKVSDWEYSSFHRDVQKGIFELDWGGDISELLINLDYE